MMMLEQTSWGHNFGLNTTNTTQHNNGASCFSILTPTIKEKNIHDSNWTGAKRSKLLHSFLNFFFFFMDLSMYKLLYGQTKVPR